MNGGTVERYAAYQESGIEWLGEVPAHWEVKRIKDISLVKRGASPRPIDNPVYFDEHGEYSWVRIADLTASERYLLTTKERLSELGASLSVKRYPGAFFLSIAGTVGKPIITKIKCCIHDGFVWFLGLKIDPEFLYYIFSTGLPYKGLGKLGTQLNLNTETVGLISIPLPSRLEIEDIVRYLDTKTAQIDQKIALLDQKAAQYSKLKQSLINETVTRGLDSSVPMKDSGVEWIGEVPAHWEICRLKDKAVFNPFKSEIKLLPSVCTFAPMEKLKKDFLLTDTSVITSNISSSYTYFREGDILVAKVTPCFENRNIAIAKNLMNGIGFGSSEINVIRVSKKVNNRWFLYLFLSSNFIEAGASCMAGAGGLKRIPSTFLETFIFAIPSLFEQTAIAAYLDTKTAQIDQIIANLQTQIDRLKDLRKALINDVVTGKIKVTHQGTPA